MFEYLATNGYDDEKLEQLGGQIGLIDTVTTDQLSAAGVPPRVVFHIRRHIHEMVGTSLAA